MLVADYNYAELTQNVTFEYFSQLKKQSNILKFLPRCPSREILFGQFVWNTVLMQSGPILLPEPENDAFCFIKIKPKQWLAFWEMLYLKIDTSSSSLLKKHYLLIIIIIVVFYFENVALFLDKLGSDVCPRVDNQTSGDTLQDLTRPLSGNIVISQLSTHGYWSNFLVAGCSSAPIREETLESGNLFSGSWISTSVPTQYINTRIGTWVLSFLIVRHNTLITYLHSSG